MVDRLGELRLAWADEDDDNVDGQRSPESAVAPFPSDSSSSDSLPAATSTDLGSHQRRPGGGTVVVVNHESRVFMADFFEEAAVLRGDVRRLQDLVEDLADAHLAVAAATSDHAVAGANADLVDIRAEASDLAVGIRPRLDAMRTANADFEARHAGSAEARIRGNTYRAVTRGYAAAVRAMREAEAAHAEATRTAVARRFKQVFPEATDADVEAVLANPDGERGQVYAVGLAERDAQTSEASRAAAERMLSDVRDKHDDIVALEASIAQLFQLFQDMATLVEVQGEMLDVIEHNVATTKAYTAKAAVDLERAVVLQKKARKVRPWVMVVCTRCVWIFGSAFPSFDLDPARIHVVNFSENVLPGRLPCHCAADISGRRQSRNWSAQ